MTEESPAEETMRERSPNYCDRCFRCIISIVTGSLWAVWTNFLWAIPLFILGMWMLWGFGPPPMHEEPLEEQQ